ncbi:Molybdenum cofactor biosynthetic protein [Lasiodiplodia theobromae]|uniref:Adenylyltransferase and sulfurtransferase uba4 n=1 Tax=Lasiodiplodia theobromae TaxID=45133 RepID=A0A5N5DUV1_9PEZI|nr:Molybdenum cofactor biosynthetic protein [Lasiodiplodia theobromae]KAB2580732.1 Adenylyltransferase and sulfurtransferase uba4 [Lasiodiplodia theobromae]KAF4539704.1 Molybdenum cofactor biosynthetic protein [Lasiodiplodia theobromae]
MPIDSSIASLQHEIASCERQLQRLKQQLADAEDARSRNQSSSSATASYSYAPSVPTASLPADTFHSDIHHNRQFLGAALGGGLPDEWQAELWAVLEQPAHDDGQRRWPLEKHEYRRYGRQLIMPEVGLQGQLRLRSSAVLIIGAGGLGCPAAAYIAGAGVGTLGMVDGDTVEESNLHRQILHSTSKVGMPKVESALRNLKCLNPNVRYYSYNTRLTPENAQDIFSEYDIVLDCTDTPASRYLISDTCVLLGKPLVSASALRTEGQLMVLNNPPRPPGDSTGGPCYRCVFPKPPPAESVISCGEGGILGPVVGVMGVLQALEAIKVITAGIERPPSDEMDVDGASPASDKLHDAAAAGSKPTSNKPSLLLFSAYSNPQFRSFGLRTRKAKCAACSAQATVTRQALTSGSMDYVQFCGAVGPINALSPEERISALDYHQARNGIASVAKENSSPFSDGRPESQNHILVDVREKVQFELAHLDDSINIPFSDIVATAVPQLSSSSSPPASASTTPATPATGSADSPASPKQATEGGNTNDQLEPAPAWLTQLRQLPAEKPIVVTCRLGNDSQLAVRKMKALGLDGDGKRMIVDVRGGLRAWRENVDAEFPDY